MRVVGCIGCGVMGSALVTGFLNGAQSEWRVAGFNRTPEKMAPLKAKGMEVAASVGDLCARSDIVIIAVKPQQLNEVLRECSKTLKKDAILVSVAAGQRLEEMRLQAGPGIPIARCMPTTTAAVGHGVFAFCFDPLALTDERKTHVIELFGTIGTCIELQEKMFPAFSALIGAGPAYVFAMMQGLAQAGLTLGFPLNRASIMINELFLGCAALARERGEHFTSLRDEVCSPGGLSIAGVNTLDRAGFTGLIIDAVQAAEQRGREMEARQ